MSHKNVTPLSHNYGKLRLVITHTFVDWKYKSKPVENIKDIKSEILFRAEKLAHYNGLLINQCDSWLTGEEGDENMMRKFKDSKIQRFKDSKN